MASVIVVSGMWRALRVCSLSSQGSLTWVCLQHSESAIPLCRGLQGSGSVPPALPGLLMETMACSEIFPSCNQLWGCLCCERAPGECSASTHSLGGFLISPWLCLGLADGAYQKPNILGATTAGTEPRCLCSSDWTRWKTGLNMTRVMNQRSYERKICSWNTYSSRQAALQWCAYTGVWCVQCAA